MRINAILYVLLFTSGYCLNGYASDAYLDTGNSVGQGFLIERENRCYLITPGHVVDGHESISLMTADRKKHSAELFRALEVDLAILSVPNVKACRHKQPAGTTRLKSLLKIYRDGVLKSKLADGSTRQTKVEITGIDQSEYLQIRPMKSEDVLKQGYSGSVLYIAEQPSGILLEVGEDNTGYVYRQDALSQKLAGIFTVPSSEKPLESPNAPPTTSKLKGQIANGQTQETQFSWQENSPVKLSIADQDRYYLYTLQIINEPDEELFTKNIDGRKGYVEVFTPPASGVYTLRLTGYKDHGKYNIEVDQYALDSELRGAGNVVEIGDTLSGVIAVDTVAEYKAAWQQNSPVKLSIADQGLYYLYTLRIINESDEELFEKNIDGRKGYVEVFTPPASGVYTLSLTGYKNHGKYSIEVDQYALDSGLRGAGNVVEIGDRLSGVIAVDAVAEYKGAWQQNSPVKLSIADQDLYYLYTLRIINESDEELFAKNIDGRKAYVEVFTPPASGVYTLSLAGYKNHGKYSIEVDQYALDSGLRGAGNVVEIGDRLSGVIAVDAVAEYKGAWQQNSPVKLSIADQDLYYLYTLRIFNESDEELFAKNIDGRKAYVEVFTPPASGVYTLSLTGYKNHGKYNIEVGK